MAERDSVHAAVVPDDGDNDDGDDDVPKDDKY